MKNFVKHSIVATAAIALAGSVYATTTPTLVIYDGASGTIDSVTTYATGAGSFSISGDGWSVIGTLVQSQPPLGGLGTASSPIMDLDVSATYTGNGSTGVPLEIAFGSGLFGPTTGNLLAGISLNAVSGSGTVGYSTYYNTGGAVPSSGTPVPAGSTLATSQPGLHASGFYSALSGHLNLSSYSLDQVITLNATSGATFSIDSSLSTVPDGGMTLMLLGSALSGLALLKKKLI